MKRINFLLTIILMATLALPALSCSSFVLKNGKKVLLGKNFDWTFDQGYVIKNLRNIEKFAYFSHEGRPTSWTSKYGSITFNQNGKEMPYGGMNERGLVVEMLWLEETRFNITDDKEYLNELEWIQYQLDNFETIDEVVSSIENLKIYPIKGKIHYILADKNGKSVIIEYLDGKPRVYEKSDNECQAITNKTVVYSEKFIDNLDGIQKRNTSETYRYHQLENQIRKLQSPDDYTEKTAFEMLKKVSITKGNFKTVWSIVYNIENTSISFFSETNTKIKQINLSNIDFDHTPSYYDINQNADIVLDNKLKPISEPVNYIALAASLTHLGFDTLLCTELSTHQMNPQLHSDSYFSQNYFHFDIRIPVSEQGKRMLFAVMDSEENFNRQKAVTGGYMIGTTVVGMFNSQIYGLQNGKYSVIALIDENKNSKLDFDSAGNPTEQYITLTDFKPKSMEELTFQNTSMYFDKVNSKITLAWK